MRLAILSAVLLLCVFAVATHSEEIKGGPLAVGKNVPATFHPYNVTARIVPPEELEEADKEEAEKAKEKDKKVYTTKGKFHCLVTEYDLDPVVMLVARNLNDSEGFRELLKQLDATIDKNRARRMRAFVVFHEPELGNVVADDEKREALAKGIEKIAEGLALKNVVLTLAGKNDLDKYALDDKALTVIMYRTLKIRSSHSLGRDEIDKADAPVIKTLMGDVTEKLLAKR